MARKYQYTMELLLQDLPDMIRHGEEYQHEYKEAETKLPKSTCDTVSSFSNREGDDIFLEIYDCDTILGCDETEVEQTMRYEQHKHGSAKPFVDLLPDQYFRHQKRQKNDHGKVAGPL